MRSVALPIHPQPPRSALTLRLVLAIYGFLVCTSATAAFVILDLPIVPVVIAAVLAVVAGVDIAVIIKRMQRRERG